MLKNWAIIAVLVPFGVVRLENGFSVLAIYRKKITARGSGGFRPAKRLVNMYLTFEILITVIRRTSHVATAQFNLCRMWLASAFHQFYFACNFDCSLDLIDARVHNLNGSSLFSIIENIFQTYSGWTTVSLENNSKHSGMEYVKTEPKNLLF